MNTQKLNQIKKDYHENKNTLKQLSKKYNTPTSTLAYHLNPKTKQNTKKRAIKWQKQNHEKRQQQHKNYINSPQGKKSVAKAWIRYNLKNKTLTKKDIQQVMNEFGDDFL